MNIFDNMVFILSNIFFGYPKLYKYQQEFFHDFIVLVNQGKNEIYFTGDIFYNTNHMTFKTIIDFKRILRILSKENNIFILNNDYCYELFSDVSNKIDKINFDISNVNLFQLSKEDNNKIGYYILKNDKLVFIENKKSPRYIEHKIETIDDLNNVNITNNFIDVIINSELLENQQNKNLIDIFINNNPKLNFYFTEKIVVEEKKVKLDTNNINIRNILIDNIEDDLKEELGEIFKVYDENPPVI